MDDLVVKSKKRLDHLQDLRQIFKPLWKCQLKMTPLKCAFGFTLRNFWALLFDSEVSRLTQLKARAIQDMPPPRNLKKLQGLQGLWPILEDSYQILLVVVILLVTSWRRERLSNGMTHAKKPSIASKGTCWVLQFVGTYTWQASLTL